MVDYFSVTLTTEHERAQLQLRGELDVAAVDDFAAKVDEAGTAGPSLLLIDLTELSFCDSSGIHVLIRTAARCTCMNIEMRLVGPQSNVRRVLELTGTAELLHLVGDGDE